MNKRAIRVLRICVGVVAGAAFLLHFILLYYDFKQIENGKEPLFSSRKYELTDGGSVVYGGFGYSLISYHYITEKYVDGKKVLGYTTGVNVEGLPILEQLDKVVVWNKYKFVPSKVLE